LSVPSSAQRRCSAVLLLVLAALSGSLLHSGETRAQPDNGLIEAESSRSLRVNCDAGQTIGRALQRAKPGDRIVVRGTCRERVIVSTDRVTLDGQGSAILDGGGGAPTELTGLVTIDGARGVTITGFTIQNGPGDGILALHAATLHVRNTTVQDNVFMGIAVIDHSTAELTDLTARRNRQGIDVFNASLAILRGSIVITDNRSIGSDLGGRSTMEIRGAQVHASNNEVGLGAGNGQLVVYNLAASQASTITVSNNRKAGFGIGTSTFEIFGTTRITAENNGFGLFCPAGGKLLDPFGRGTFVFRNNGVGMFFSAGCSALVNPAMLTIQSNATGVLADAADTLSFATDPANGSTITGNGTDVDLKFGTRATLQGITIGTIVCDKTVLSRGSTVCP
jgi:nitrous oxidase accessory protein NosD